MNRSQKLRRVYAELKNIFANTMNDGDILDCAAALVAASGDTLLNPVHQPDRGRVGFFELEVDLAMERGPWKIVCSEWSGEDDFFPQVPEEVLLQECLERAA